MIPNPQHDIWIRVLDTMVDSHPRSMWKSCNLVCATWHSYFQPRLMSTLAFTWKNAVFTEGDMQSLLRLQHLFQRLRVGDWPVHAHSLSFSEAFTNITTLELVRTSFYTAEDMSTLFASMGNAVQNLALIECELDQSDNSRFTSNPLYALCTRDRKLLSLHMESTVRTGSFFSEIMTHWLVEGSLLNSFPAIRYSVDDTTLTAPRLCMQCAESLELVLLEGGPTCMIESRTPDPFFCSETTI
jgi:hypothetical protein